jgi:hypothetical protein
LNPESVRNPTADREVMVKLMRRTFSAVAVACLAVAGSVVLVVALVAGGTFVAAGGRRRKTDALS